MSETIFIPIFSPFGIRNKLIVVLHDRGMRVSELSEIYGVTPGRISQIYRNETRRRWYTKAPAPLPPLPAPRFVLGTDRFAASCEHAFLLGCEDMVEREIADRLGFTSESDGPEYWLDIFKMQRLFGRRLSQAMGRCQFTISKGRS